MNYHNITKDDMLNGDGLRVVLWVAGCTHRCPSCHNPETWDVFGGIPFDAAARRELWEELRKDYVSGITFSGGDPLHPENIKEVEKLARECKTQFPEKNHLAVYRLFLGRHSGTAGNSMAGCSGGRTFCGSGERQPVILEGK